MSAIQWIATTKPQTRESKALSYLSAGWGGKRADVDRIGICDDGVVFTRPKSEVLIPWQELIQSKMQYGRGFLVLRPKAGTEPRGGPWVVDRAQGRAILSHARWIDPAYATRVIPEWLE